MLLHYCTLTTESSQLHIHHCTFTTTPLPLHLYHCTSTTAPIPLNLCSSTTPFCRAWESDTGVVGRSLDDYMSGYDTLDVGTLSLGFTSYDLLPCSF